MFLNDAEHSDDPAAQEIAFYVPGTSVDKAEGVPPTPPPTEEDVAETYTGPNWTKDALKAEIERRNAEYDEEFQMSTEGSKADLVARLVEDDLTTE